MKASKDQFRVSGGAIVDRQGAVLYDSDSIRDLTPRARRRLAALHTQHADDQGFDWEHAEVILVREKLLPPSARLARPKR